MRTGIHDFVYYYRYYRYYNKGLTALDERKMPLLL